jgi:ribosomal subunit interface protein
MNTTITARHCDVGEDIKQRATDLLERVSKLAQRPQSAEVVFNVDHQSKIVELILHLPRGVTRVASAEADTFPTAMDKAADKLRHQLEKDKDLAKDARRQKTA